MASVETADFSDIKKAGAGFSFTGNMAKMAVNDEWVNGYEAVANPNIKPNQYTSMWTALSSGAEEVGNDFYVTIRNYIDDIGNIDTCGIEGLMNFANILGVKNDYLNNSISFPIEIRKLIEVFSVNPAYLYNKSTDGSEDTLVLSNSILHYSTVEQFLSALKDKEKYAKFVNDVFYNTLMEFLNLKTVAFDDSVNGNVQKEIWRTDINRFLNRLWSDDITSDEEVYALKERLGVDKSFTEKIYADDIMSGKRKLTDFSDIEQTVLKVEMKNRETRYGDSNAMRYYYMRLFKVVEYFRFVTVAYSNTYRLGGYPMDANQYEVEAGSNMTLLKYNYTDYEIETNMVRKVSSWLTELSFGIRSDREDMKTQCRKNMMVGTKRLIVDLIRKFILEKIDGGIYGDVRDSILYSAGLNRKFGVSVVEYSDMTEYFNIENAGDAVKPSDYNLNGRYWESYDDDGNAFTSDDTLAFYNRLFKDSKRFVSNSSKSTDGANNLYEFLSMLFEAGAVSNTNSDYYLSSDSYVADYGGNVRLESTYELGADEKARLAKFSGDDTFAATPYANHKNTFHPSYQLHPFIQAFEEYNEAYTSIINLVNSYTEDLHESFRRLKYRLDDIGNTLNFWYNWNDDFSGYSTGYEKGGSDYDRKLKQDGPFDFEALQSFISYPSEYINNLMNGTNRHYFNESDGKWLLTEDERRLESGRLQKYQSQIAELADREIYKYGKDRNGNIYILYKDKGHRNDRNALGDVWVRLRNHPIAFPLFDLSFSPVRLNEMSCLKESDNTKLLSVLTKIFKFFDDSYGLHHIDGAVLDGSVVSDGLMLAVGTYGETVPVTRSGSTSSCEFTYGTLPVMEYGKFRLVAIDNTELEDFVFSNRMKEKTVYTIADIGELSSIESTWYFRDSVTGEDIGADGTVSKVFYKEGGVETVASNPTGRIIGTTGDSFMKALYDPVKSTIEISPLFEQSERRILFAEYDDSNSDDGRYYYCYNSVSDKTHACTKREVVLKRLIALPYSALSGDVYDTGDVAFGGLLPTDTAEPSGETPFSGYSVRISSKEGYDVLDGGRVYENFSKYRYQYDGQPVDSSSIVLLGGCNPYYIKRTGAAIELVEASISEGVARADAIEFSDGLYRTNVGGPDKDTTLLSSVPFTACEFTKTSRGRYSDTIGQFYVLGRPYDRYYPYTTVTQVTTSKSELSEDLPYGIVTLYGANGTDNATFYYNVNPTVDIRQIYSDTHTATMSLTSCKFGGKLELVPYDNVEYPITLDFSASDCENVATYSSMLSELSQHKFFDMGFSYNQKLLYLSYTDDLSGDYMDGGTIVGTIDESYDENYSPILVFHRDSSHNVEFVDTSTSFLSSGDDTFHIGDVSSKRGIFTAYGKYHDRGEGDRYVEISLTLFSSSDVRTWKYNVEMKSPLYDEFNDGGSRYSFSISCTDDRLYVSFTTRPPSDDSVISTTLNGVNGGLLCSTTFGQLSSTFMDCMIEVVSFDITGDEVEYLPSETRYILGGGEIGYFQQFAGMSGKSAFFSNDRLRTDMSFPIQPQFPELTADFDIKLLHEYDSAIDGFSSNRGVRRFDRYINLTPYTNPSFDEVTGFLVEDSHEKAILSVSKKDGNGRSVEFGSIGGRSIIDISRGLDGGGYYGIVDTYGELPEGSEGLTCMVLEPVHLLGSNTRYPSNSIFTYTVSGGWVYVDSVPNHGVNIISDGANTSNRCAAFVDVTTAPNAVDVNGKNLVLIPIHSEVHGYTRVDFDEMVDSGTDVYTKHTDGKTVSKLSVESEYDGFEPVSGICEYSFTPRTIVRNYSSLPSTAAYGTIIQIEEGDSEHEAESMYRFVHSGNVGAWEECIQSEIDKSTIVAVGPNLPAVLEQGYYESSTIGGRNCYGFINGGVAMWMGAYGDATVMQSRITNSTVQNGSMTYGSAAFSVEGEPVYAYPSQIFNDAEIPYVHYVSNVIRRNGDGTYSIISAAERYGTESDGFDLSVTESLCSFADTSYPSVKMFSTSLGYVYKYDISKGEKTISHVFDALSADLAGMADGKFASLLSESREHLMVSYWSDAYGMNGVLWTRKNTPDAVGEAASFMDENGEEVATEPIVKLLSVNGRVLAEERGGHRIFLSVDDGETFRQISSADDVMHLVGCGTNRFYARWGNGEKVYSTDGTDWVNADDIHASTWSVVNASGVDYIACDGFDKDLRDGIYERNKYVMVKSQMALDGGPYDKMCVTDDGTVVCIAGMDGTSVLKTAVIGDVADASSVRYHTHSQVRDISFSNAMIVGDSVLLSPNGGMNALKISGLFGDGGHVTEEFIDISDAVNNEVNIFGGFGHANGRTIMYPDEGNLILVYDAVNSRFYNLYAFDEVMTLCDCDSIDFTEGSDAMLSPRTSTIDGRIRFSRTAFDDRADYGIVEIDEGFPIIVGYSKIQLKNGDDTAEAYKIMLLFANDIHRRTFSIISKCSNYSNPSDHDAFDDIVDGMGHVDGVYEVNGAAFTYSFDAVDDTNKFVVTRRFPEYATSPVNDEYLSIELSYTPSETVSCDYSVSGPAKLWIHGDGTDERYVTTLD